MSRKPEKTDKQDTIKRKHKKKTKQTITRAVTHIGLIEANPGKLEALDRLVAVYLALCQQYVRLLCTQEATPDKYASPALETELSDRWHRVAIQQAAGIAKSWRTNRQAAYEAYLEDLADWKLSQEVSPNPKRKAPNWKEWQLPELRVPCIQANENVVRIEPSEDSTFDYWLCISTLDKGHPLRIPVKLAPYHSKALEGHTFNTSTTLHKRKGVWWLTLSFDEDVPLQSKPAEALVGIDVGIANFVTTSTGKQYGSFHGKLYSRQKRDREKRRRKAQLRACLKKKGEEKLLSTSSASGQRLSRHVRQSINRAVNQMLTDHPNSCFIYEDLSVASMRFKAKAMNAYLYASNLGHIPEQLAWATAKRGMTAYTVKAAYSSQECYRCHYPDRANRSDQSTFTCIVCHHSDHADHNAAANLARRFGDKELAACTHKGEVKALLMKRHVEWMQNNRLAVVQPPAQLGLWGGLETSTGLG